MASTYAPIQAFDWAKRFIKNMPLEQVSPQILDDALKMFWMAAPWRWTLAGFPNVTLTNNTQDYTVTLPSDFLFIQDAYITDQAGNVPRSLQVVAFIPPGGKQGQISEIAVVTGTPGGSGTLRTYPQPGTIRANEIIVSVYKKQCPLLIPNNVNTVGVQVFDDEWFWVYESAVLYFAYLYGDDQRAGGAQIDPTSGKVTFTGQRGVFEANVQYMKEREKLLILDPNAGFDQKMTK